MTVSPDQRTDYWDKFYATSMASGANPSQFAVFVHGETSGPKFVVDIGCGSGRDSFFFAANGHAVLGVDGSRAAVENCQGVADRLGSPTQFYNALVSDPRLADVVNSIRGNRSPAETVVYARFFIHAITQEEEAAFLSTAAKICTGGGSCAVEFRTRRDAEHSKFTPTHFRRFVDPLEFMSAASRHGFSATYFVEGYGYAKYKTDDAHVARMVLTSQ